MELQKTDGNDHTVQASLGCNSEEEMHGYRQLWAALGVWK